MHCFGGENYLISGLGANVKRRHSCAPGIALKVSRMGVIPCFPESPEPVDPKKNDSATAAVATRARMVRKVVFGIHSCSTIV